MSRNEPRDSTSPSETQDEFDPVELVAELEVLTEENQRLRDEYARAKRTQYRRTALGFFALGIIGLGSAVLFPIVRSLLIALGATGVFAGVLTYYLTPEQFISANLGRDVYTTAAKNIDALMTELGLQDSQVYVPIPTATAETSCRLFVPHQANYTVPAPNALQSLFVATEDASKRGIALEPTGNRLFEEFKQTLTTDLGSTPNTLALQLSDGIVEQFNLCEDAHPDVDPVGGRATIGIVGSTFGPVDRVDHPIVSFVGVAFARGLGHEVESAVTVPDEAQADFLITIEWESSEDDTD